MNGELDGIFVGIIVAGLIMVVAFISAILGALLGYLAGWIIGITPLGGVILSFLDAAGIHGIDMPMFGSFLGFVAGFLKADVHLKKDG